MFIKDLEMFVYVNNVLPFQISKPKNYFSLYSVGERQNTIIMNSPIIGSELGIPLNILQLIFTTTYYNEIIINPKLILLQFCIGVFTYGNDRYWDAIEYSNTNNTDIYSPVKRDYYDYIIDNKANVELQLFMVSFYLMYIILQDYSLFPIFPLLTSTINYRNFKRQYGEYKAIYIGVMWTIATVILPCIIHDHNYEILQHPNIYLPDVLLMFGSSNMLDVKDVEEDSKNKINTLPVIFGDKKAIMISNIAYLTGISIFVSNFLNLK